MDRVPSVLLLKPRHRCKKRSTKLTSSQEFGCRERIFLWETII